MTLAPIEVSTSSQTSIRQVRHVRHCVMATAMIVRELSIIVSAGTLGLARVVRLQGADVTAGGRTARAAPGGFAGKGPWKSGDSAANSDSIAR